MNDQKSAVGVVQIKRHCPIAEEDAVTHIGQGKFRQEFFIDSNGLLRQHLLTLADDDDAKWGLLLRSLPAFGTLFRHALIALGDAVAGSKREAAAALGSKLAIDTGVFAELLDIRERKKDRKSVQVNDLFARYLTLVDQVTAAVDKMLDPAA